MKKFAPLVLLVFCLYGCASGSRDLSKDHTLYYPACYKPLQEARHLDNRARSVADGAGKGLLVGALAGAAGGAISALFTGNARSILTGAAIGAGSGAVVGGVTGGVTNNASQKNVLLSQWYQQIDGDINDLDFNGAAATVSLQCYEKRRLELRQEVNEGRMTEAAALPRFQEIDLGSQEAQHLLNASRK